MTVHQYNPNSLPDDHFQPGAFKFLLVGNQCRLLDRRRTPGVIEGVYTDSAMFRFRIHDFEDKGKFWDLPFDDVTGFQFAKDAKLVPAQEVVRLESTNKKFLEPLLICPQKDQGQLARQSIAELSIQIRDWLLENSGFFKTQESFDFKGQRGSDLLARDLVTYMELKGLSEHEKLTSETYVLNPHSGEWIKGLQIVFAEMGLKTYAGTVPRTSDISSGLGEKHKRREYILHRLAFVKAAFNLLGRDELTLFRGMACEGAWRTFPVEKLFMTYVETAAMNSQYEELEAVVVHDEFDERLW
jgi:hypothetical protein